MNGPEHVNVSPAVLTVEKIDQKHITVDEDKKTELLLKFTEQHPDVVLANRQLTQLEEERSLYLRRHKQLR